MLATLIGSKKFNKGISVVEILIVIGIISISLIILSGIAILSLKSSILIKQTSQANFLAQEVIEAAKSFRDGTDWETDGLGILTAGADYYPQKSGSPPEWQLLMGTETINGFTRKIVFERVSRNPITENIEDTYDPVRDDPDTRKAVVTVFWENREVEIATYFTNWRR